MSYRFMKFLNLNETQWSPMISRRPRMDVGDISRTSSLRLLRYILSFCVSMHSDLVIARNSKLLHVQARDPEWKIVEFRGITSLMFEKSITSVVEMDDDDYLFTYVYDRSRSRKARKDEILINISVRIVDEAGVEIENIVVPTRASPIVIRKQEYDSEEDEDKSYYVTTTSYSCRLRIDAYFPLIFGKEVPDTCGYGTTSLNTIQLKNNFTMLLEWRLSESSNIDIHYPIETGTFLVGSSTAAVCAELVSLVSPVLCAMFYGSYIERDMDIKEVKEVDEEHFIWLLNSIHSNNWKDLTVVRAIYAIAFIDRFAMLSLHKNIFQYLMRAEISDEMRCDVLSVTDKIPNGKHIIDRICGKLQLEQMVLLMKDAVRSVSKETMASLLEVTEQSIDRQMLEERNVAITYKERSDSPQYISQSCFNTTIRFHKTFNIWKNAPYGCGYLRFRSKGSRQWSDIKSHGEVFDLSSLNIEAIEYLKKNA